MRTLAWSLQQRSRQIVRVGIAQPFNRRTVSPQADHGGWQYKSSKTRDGAKRELGSSRERGSVAALAGVAA